MSCIQSSNTCQILPKITKYRDDKIRTCDPRDPNTVRYQAALHPDKIVKSTYSVFNFLRYHLFKNLPIGVTFCSAECYIPKLKFIYLLFILYKISERQDLNLRPLPPQGSTLPSCATSRNQIFSYQCSCQQSMAF